MKTQEEKSTEFFKNLHGKTNRKADNTIKKSRHEKRIAFSKRVYFVKT